MVVKRKHTPENVAPAIRTLRSQFDRLWPDRDKASDGIWPSPEHTKANPTSDHEAGNAIDIDDDLSGKDGREPSISLPLVARVSHDPRCKYAIHDGFIFKGGIGTIYRGANKHKTHLHVSVHESKRDDASGWDITGRPVLKRGDRGERVVWLQRALNTAPDKALRPVPALVVDGVFGPKTAEAVAKVRKARGIGAGYDATGAVWRALGF